MCRVVSGKAESTTAAEAVRSSDSSASVREAIIAEEIKQLKETIRDPPPEAFENLKLNLGLPWWLVRSLVSFEPSWLKTVVGISSKVTAIFVEPPLFWLLGMLPDKFFHVIMIYGFQILLFFFRLLPSCISRCGPGEEMSTEGHLLTALMWPARLSPLSIAAMRFGLKSCGWCNLATSDLKEEPISVPELGVEGVWIHTAPSDVEDPPVFVFFYGGAFVGGEVSSYRGIAARYAQRMGGDAFVPSYRLLPEHTIQDALLDGARAYEWLLSRKAASKIVLFGVSAGSGVLMNTLLVAKSTDPEERSKFFHGTGPTPQPAAAVHVGPLVDFTMPVTGSSLINNTSIDIIVTQRTLEACMPVILETSGPMKELEKMSPLHRDLSGLCPQFVSYSLHEACTDMCAEFVKRLGAAGNNVGTFTVPYMGHVFQMFPAFLPEAQRHELAAISWIQQIMSATSGKSTKPQRQVQ